METAQTTVINVSMVAPSRLASTTVIVPTTAVAARRASLLNAIGSAGEQSGAVTRILVVVNGQRFDRTLMDLLRSRVDVDVIGLQQADLPAALLAGRRLVETEFFCFLDDDDEILPDGLALRVQALIEHPEVALVATNGYYRSNGEDQIAVRNAEAVAADSLLAMTDQCWLTSCGGLYRTNLVDASTFVGVPRFLEWTFLGLKLASKRKMLFLDQPTFRVYDSEDSLSKSVDYRVGALAALDAALELSLPHHVTSRLRRRVSDMHHDMAEDHLKLNKLRSAWAHHLASLAQPDGLRYLLFSRRLIPFWPRSSLEKSINGVQKNQDEFVDNGKHARTL